MSLAEAIPASCATLAAMAVATAAASIPPAVTHWKLNRTGATGYAGITADVTLVRHSADFVYVTCSGIPGYAIGPWPGNPNTPTNGNWVYKLTLNPVPATGTPTAVGLGHVAILLDGTAIYNARDARSYNNQGIWNQTAWYFERASFDACLGHPSPQREWHPHALPTCMIGAIDPARHSPLIGFAFDGYPIYGPFGYANADGSGGIARIASGFRTRSITARTSLPNGTQLAPSQYGPAIGGSYPLGCYVEDWEFVSGLGHLDRSNGRFCVTPEFPQGTYCYFVTVDAQLQPVYPYILGETYRGTVTPGNTGPNGGHNSPGAGEAVVQFAGRPCPCDLNGSGSVNGDDLGMLLTSWGPAGGGADLTRDGSVNGDDLGAMLAAWGPCPP